MEVFASTSVGVGTGRGCLQPRCLAALHNRCLRGTSGRRPHHSISTRSRRLSILREPCDHLTASFMLFPHSCLLITTLLGLLDCSSDAVELSSRIKLLRNPLPTDADIFLAPLSKWPVASLPSSARILITTKRSGFLRAEVMSLQDITKYFLWEDIYSDGWTDEAKSARNDVIQSLFAYLKGGGDIHQLYYIDRTGDFSSHYFFRGSLYYLLLGYHDEDTLSLCKCNTRVQYMMYRNLRNRIINRSHDAEACFFICGQILRQNGQKLIHHYGKLLQNVSPTPPTLYPFREPYGSPCQHPPSLHRELDSLLKCFSETK